MLQSLQLKQFTVFGKAQFDFADGLNIIVGENGLGKTHVLKAGYCLLDVLARGRRESGSETPSKKYLQAALSRKLRNVFRPDALGRLARRRRGVNRAEVTWGSGPVGDCSISFTTKSDSEVDLDTDGRFYLATSEGRVEMHLVAEGLRKLAAIARLIATGSLLDKGALFWEEPESNLHPRLIKEVAATIVRVAQSGVQVFIGTHSLFLLRELEMILEKSKVGTRYFGLHRGSSGVAVAQGESIDDVGDLGVLDEELQQSKRFLAQGA